MLPIWKKHSLLQTSSKLKFTSLVLFNKRRQSPGRVLGESPIECLVGKCSLSYVISTFQKWRTSVSCLLRTSCIPDTVAKLLGGTIDLVCFLIQAINPWNENASFFTCNSQYGRHRVIGRKWQIWNKSPLTDIIKSSELQDPCWPGQHIDVHLGRTF